MIHNSPYHKSSPFTPNFSFMHQLHALLLFISIASIAQTPKEAGRIYISRDNGLSWQMANTGFPNDAVTAWVVNDGMVIAGTNSHGIYISSDQTKSWYASSKGLPKNVRIISLVVHEKMLYAGTYTNGLFISDDNGETWHASNTGLKNLTIRCFYSQGPLLLVGTNDGVYSSTDGKSWIVQKDGLQLNAFSSAGNQIFAATNQGVFVSKNYGKTWNWIFKEGAIQTLAANAKEIFLEDFFGAVYKSSTENFVWLKADLYLPLLFTFRLTPASPKFLTLPWKGVIKNLNGMQGDFPYNGLPKNYAFTEILNTPFGLLAGAIITNDHCYIFRQSIFPTEQFQKNSPWFKPKPWTTFQYAATASYSPHRSSNSL